MTARRLLFFTDPHFTDREQDAYRWKLFPFLKEVEERFGHIDILGCLGDLTEHKDCHSSALLHRILKELKEAPGDMKMILAGNHDYVDGGEPFFDWLGELDRQTTNMFYCADAAFYDGGILVLPHTRNPVEDWKGWGKIDRNIRLVLTHITVDGCQSEMGTILPGISRTAIPGSKALVLSGDIHKPQHLGPDFIYVGTPYSTRFSPPYTPRVLLLEFDSDDEPFNPKITSIPTGLKRKMTVRATREELEACLAVVPDIGPEDELRITVPIPAHTTPSEWKAFRESMDTVYPGVGLIPLVERGQAIEQVENNGVGIHTHPEDALNEYCTAAAVPDALTTVGRNLLRRRVSAT